MKVSELIELLNKFDPDTLVLKPEWDDVAQRYYYNNLEGVIHSLYDRKKDECVHELRANKPPDLVPVIYFH